MIDLRKKSLLTAGTELQWIQPSAFRRRYELRFQEKVIARLEFPSFFSTQAKADSEEGCWMFQRSGFLNPKVEIREYNKELRSATYVPKMFGGSGTLQLSLGRSLIFRLNMWQTKAEFVTDKGELLFSMKVHGIFRSGATVVVHEKAAEYSEAKWVILFAWYLVLLEQRRRRAH